LRRLVVDYFTYTARLGASARRVAHRLSSTTPRHAGSSSTTPPRTGSSSTTSSTSRVWEPRRVARLIACRQQLRLRRATGCLSTSCGSSRGSLHRSSSTTSPTPRVRVPRHVARPVTRLIVDYSVRRYFSCEHAGSTSVTPCVVTTFLAATLALLQVRRALPRRRLLVALRRPFISTSFQTSRERQSRPQQLVGINSD
jgi:hypothetical protein